MYKSNEIRQVHLEITSRCQASCPMCARNYHGGLPNPLLQEADLSLAFVKNAIPPSFVRQLETITFCGNYGDPILNRELIEMVKYFAHENPNIKIDIHTNGSARRREWWRELAQAMPANHCVQFGIDGLADTHALYRVGTDFDTILLNAQAFISEGGLARWNFITFEHNEHQLEAARALAAAMGFESFYEKQTSRFIGSPSFPVLNRAGETTHVLGQPGEQKLVFIDKKTVGRYRELIDSCTIKCEVEETESIYIDALGSAWPCCFVGAVPYIHARPEQLVYDYNKYSHETFEQVVEAFGGRKTFDLHHTTIVDLVDSPGWQTIWDGVFENRSLAVCARTCGKFPEAVVSQCRDQFIDLDVFRE